ncbi:MAG: hypothetical protein J5J06_09865 [Phycisphaerae bacterium]|nr:hypothetical protein [Phycisphaerae bacterium]
MKSPKSRCAHVLARFGVIGLFAFGATGSIARAADEIKTKKELPTWWKTPQHQDDNADLNDTEQPDGTPGSDGLPDGWETSDPTVVNSPPGTSETTIPRGQSICQVVSNAADTEKYKEYAFTFSYKTANFDNDDEVTVTITPQNAGGGAVASPAVDTHTFKGGSGNFTTVTIYTRFEEQPAQEEVCIQNNANLAGETLTVDSFDFRTTCVVPAASTVSCPSPSGGDGGSDVLVTYDPPSQTLTFSLATIDFLNVDGTRLDDGLFPDDPARGATVIVGEFALGEVLPDGIEFRDGFITVQSGPDILFSGIIPRLWIDDEAAGDFGANMFGEVLEPLFTTGLGSLWLDQFAAGFESSCAWPTLFLSTALPIEQPIRDGLAVSSPAELQLGSGGNCGMCGVTAGAVPAASTWGLITMTLAVLVVATWLVVGRREIVEKA